MKKTKVKVGDIIRTLSMFPDDAEAEFTDNGFVVGCDNDDEFNHAIECLKNNGAHEITSVPAYYENEDCITDECYCSDEKTYEDVVIEEHLFGIADNNPEFIKAIRNTGIDNILSAPIMTPTSSQLKFEVTDLHPIQATHLDEVRAHNAYVAECLGELHRREIAALLEYNTQVLAHFGMETNRCMCEIVDNSRSKKF